MTGITISGPDGLSIETLRERFARHLPVRALIGDVAMNVILTSPVRSSKSYGLGRLQGQPNNTVRWHLRQNDDATVTVVGNRV
jgi:hypothetical protein